MTATSIAAEPLPELGNDEILRYSRHLILPEFGLEAQRKLKASSVLVVGAGGLGSPLGLYLAAAGVGRLGIVDFDVVDATNLQRQVIHGTADVGRPKLDSARDRIEGLNPHVEVQTYEARFTSANALEIARRLRPRHRWHRQLPHPLPGERCLRAAREAERVRQHLPLRGTGLGARDARPGRATAASSAIRRRRDWCRVAPRAGCWACCRD